MNLQQAIENFVPLNQQQREAKAALERVLKLVLADQDKLASHPTIVTQGGVSDVDRAVRVINKQQAEIERLQVHAESEYRRGLEEGSSCQAILEIQGRERFLKELKEDGCPRCPHKRSRQAGR